jgi:hypothetical protein
LTSAVVLLLGAYFGRRYLVRATASVDATVSIWRENAVIHVRPSIQSSGLAKMTVTRSDGTPVVTVRELMSGPDSFEIGEVVDQTPFDEGEELAPGEAVTDSLLFVFRPPKNATLGWSVEFSFEVTRWPRHRWYWTAKTFVPAPR